MVTLVGPAAVCARFARCLAGGSIPFVEQIIRNLTPLPMFQVYKLTDVLALSLRVLDPVTKASMTPTSMTTQLSLQYEYFTGSLPRQGAIGSTYLLKWSFLDVALLLAIGSLRIPGPLQSRARLARYIPLLLVTDAVLFGHINVSCRAQA